MEGSYDTQRGKEAPDIYSQKKNKYLIGFFEATPYNFNLSLKIAVGLRGACIEIDLDKDNISHKITYLSDKDLQNILDAENENLKPRSNKKIYKLAA